MVDKNCGCTSCECNTDKMSIEEMTRMADDYTKPFTETVISDNIVIREFTIGHPDHLYKWHSDPDNRVIEVLEDSDWKFQYDNELPTPLITGVDIKIPFGVIHRIIPGTTNLRIKIYKS